MCLGQDKEDSVVIFQIYMWKVFKDRKSNIKRRNQ